MIGCHCFDLIGLVATNFQDKPFFIKCPKVKPEMVLFYQYTLMHSQVNYKTCQKGSAEPSR